MLVFFFADIDAAVEVYLDAHDGVGGGEQNGAVFFFCHYAKICPVIIDDCVLGYGQVEFKPFGMYVVGRCALLEVPHLLLAVGKFVYRVIHFVACIGRSAGREAY